MPIQFSPSEHSTVKSAAHWGLAFAIVSLLGLTYTVSSVFGHGLTSGVLRAVWVLVVAWQGFVLLMISSIASRSLLMDRDLRGLLVRLRRYFRLSALGVAVGFAMGVAGAKVSVIKLGEAVTQARSGVSR